MAITYGNNQQRFNWNSPDVDKIYHAYRKAQRTTQDAAFEAGFRVGFQNARIPKDAPTEAQLIRSFTDGYRAGHKVATTKKPITQNARQNGNAIPRYAAVEEDYDVEVDEWAGNWY